VLPWVKAHVYIGTRRVPSAGGPVRKSTPQPNMSKPKIIGFLTKTTCRSSKVFSSSSSGLRTLKLNDAADAKANNKAAKANNQGSGSGNSLSNSTGGGSLDSTDLSAFSGDVSITYNKRSMTDSQNIIVQNSLESALWQLVVGPDINVRQTIINSQNAIRNTQDANDKYLAQAEFIDRHGTHFIDSVIVGGNLVTESITVASNSLSLQELAILANFGFSNMFGLSSGDLSLNITFVDSYKSFEKDTTNNINVLGGDPQLANFFRGDVSPSDTFVNWAKTLIRNPAVIRPRCREISWIWESAEIQDFSKVVSDYMLGKTPF